jgi:hypothetical protein
VRVRRCYRGGCELLVAVNGGIPKTGDVPVTSAATTFTPPHIHPLQEVPGRAGLGDRSL